jgi:hypothetical protein
VRNSIDKSDTRRREKGRKKRYMINKSDWKNMK